MARSLLAFVLAAPFALAACLPTHFETVVRAAADSRGHECADRYKVTPLNGWSYRVEACEGALYYRCYTTRRSAGECCHRVADASEATALLGPASSPGDKCLSFAL